MASRNWHYPTGPSSTPPRSSQSKSSASSRAVSSRGASSGPAVAIFGSPRGRRALSEHQPLSSDRADGDGEPHLALPDDDPASECFWYEGRKAGKPSWVVYCGQDGIGVQGNDVHVLIDWEQGTIRLAAYGQASASSWAMLRTLSSLGPTRCPPASCACRKRQLPVRSSWRGRGQSMMRRQKNEPGAHAVNLKPYLK